MKRHLLALLILLLTASGCAKMFACTTDASYIIRTDGSKEVHYSSCKEQVGLDAKFGDVRVKVDKASTQDEVIAASLELNKQFLQFLKDSAAGAKAGALSGS